MKKILMILPALLMLLSGCLESGKNTRSYSEMIGTYIVRQNVPMICLDGGLYIHEASMYNYGSKNIAAGQRLKVSFTIDLNEQPENINKLGCYQATGITIAELPTYRVTEDISDIENYPNTMDGINSYGIYHQTDLDSYFVTILGNSSGSELDFKLYYKETAKSTTNVDTLKFEMRHKKKVGITNQMFIASFDIHEYKDQLNTPNKRSIIHIKLKKEGSTLPIPIEIPYTHPAYNN